MIRRKGKAILSTTQVKPRLRKVPISRFFDYSFRVAIVRRLPPGCHQKMHGRLRIQQLSYPCQHLQLAAKIQHTVPSLIMSGLHICVLIISPRLFP